MNIVIQIGIYSFLILGFPNSSPYDAQQNFPAGPKAPQAQGFVNYSNQPQYPNPNPMGMPPSLSVLGQPMVQDMAMQYGQQVFIGLYLSSYVKVESN